MENHQSYDLNIEQLLDIAKAMLEASEQIHSKNYHYQMHHCKVKNEEVKVDMDLQLKKESSTRIINFGLCPHCKTLFYHKDFLSRSV